MAGESHATNPASSVTRPHTGTRSSRRTVPPPSPPTLAQFVLLSFLLHALIIVVFGSPSGGGSQSGWRNPLSVTLRPRVPAEESLLKPTPGDLRGRAGPTFPRAVERAPRPPARTSAAPPSGRTSATPAPAPSPPDDVPAIAPPAGLPADEVLPRLDPGAPVEVNKVVVPQVKIAPIEEKRDEAPRTAPRAPRKQAVPAAPSVVPPDLPVATLPPQDVPAARALETAPPQRVEPPRASVLQGDAPPRPERDVAPTIEPTVVAPPEPPPAVRETPARIEPRPEPAPAPPAERELIPRAEEPPALRTLRDAPQFKFERETPSPAPVVPAPPVAVPAQPARSETAPLRETPPAPAAPSVLPPEPVPVPARESVRAPAAPAGDSSRPVDIAPAREPSSPPVPARLEFGARPAVDDDLRRLVEPPSASLPPVGERPRLSFEKAGPRDAIRPGGRSSGLVPLNLSPPVPDPETKLAHDIQKAAKPDCRDAYAGLGLLAVPVLLADAITDKGCRW
jgi:hypothetical protein